MVDAFKYSVKIWLTSVLLSPLIFYALHIFHLIKAAEFNGVGFIFGTAFMLGLGFMLSCPLWILLFCILLLIFKIVQNELWIRLITSLGIIVVGGILLTFLLPGTYDDISLFVSYVLTLSFGAWHYKPRSEEPEAAEKIVNQKS